MGDLNEIANSGRTQAERSEATRDRLMKATVELLRKRGCGGLRTIEVSELAGVSRGAQLHHFPNKNALIIAAIHYMNQSMEKASQQRVRSVQEGNDPLDLVVADAFDFFFSDYFYIALSVSMSDERNEELLNALTSTMLPTRAEIEREWIRLLENSGLPPDFASDVLALALSAVRGLVVRTLLNPDRSKFTHLMKIWEDMLHQYISSRLEELRAIG